MAFDSILIGEVGLGLVSLVIISVILVKHSSRRSRLWIQLPSFNMIKTGFKGLYDLGIRETVKSLMEIWFPKQTTILLHTSGKSVRISYNRCGLDYMIVAPYRRDLVSKMSGSKVLSQKGTELIDITQQPGIPYLVSANMMGADCIIVKRSGCETVYKGDQIPSFD